MESEAEARTDRLGRRAAIKAAAGVAAGVVVWSEPTIRGLARRPAYATTGTGPAVLTFTDNVAVVVPSGVPLGSTPFAPPPRLTEVLNGGATLITIEITSDGMGNVVIQAVSTDPACQCGVANITTASISDGVATVNGVLNAGRIDFTLPMGFGAFITNVTLDIGVVCV